MCLDAGCAWYDEGIIMSCQHWCTQNTSCHINQMGWILLAFAIAFIIAGTIRVLEQAYNDNKWAKTKRRRKK